MDENGGKSKGLFGRIAGSRTNIILGMVALLVLFGSLSALVYNASNTRSTDILKVNGKEYEWEALENEFDVMEYQGNSGISVREVLEDSGVTKFEGRSFRFIGSDGYEKEIPWEDMDNGMINTEEKKVIFPGLAKAFWVRDLVEIEVI